MDPLWYKDAIIYEVHVRAFADSNGDGIGDFAGLTGKLPYLQDLGVTCLWLLPFYPSPLRDDGYDIADYTSINPIYGTLDDFRRFVDEAHARQIRVLTELVVNHTSDRHPWFQRARRAPKGSPERDYYVWSDTDETYAGTRVIFTDTETSNWTFDAVAGQYYWHRFFSHQPDLNLENPAVFEAIVDAMRFWMRLGVDALRLDAIPYLVEREGTINENLPETHAMLREFRRRLDAEFPGRALLAEANQWPSDVRAYFGDGDECHMAFHFPLMPRMFMALRQEERHPIVEIMNQTPEIPETCQWAIFLRNHDELTLEMVTDEERDYMYAQYAADAQMRLNVGIRRRLAPLLENSRRRIELLNNLLFTMPGTPVLYYGDEIGMGDNVYLGDRNGVRTPMQWTSDRNAGFSRCDPARLYFPVIMDPVYGYEAINVEAQERSPFSLLSWMKRRIALRRQHPVFGRGTLEFIPTANRKVLTYVRRHTTGPRQEVVLCVANLSRTVQPVEIPLAAFAGLTPVELTGGTPFPRITSEPYRLALDGYGFYWFSLESVVSPVGPRAPAVIDDPAPVPSLFAGVVWEGLLDGGLRSIVDRQVLAPFLQRQRWFGGKGRVLRSARVVDWTTLRRGPNPAFLALVQATYADGGHERYVLPLATASGETAATLLTQQSRAVLAQITGARKGVLFDGLFDDETCLRLLDLMHRDDVLGLRHGTLTGRNAGFAVPGPPPEALLPITRSAPDQSNSSVLFGRHLMLKLFRRVEPGLNPDVEVGLFLAGREFDRVPRLRGVLEYVGDDTGGASPSGNGGPAAIAMVQDFVTNQGNGWQVTLDELGRYFERVAAEAPPDVDPDLPAAWVCGELETRPPEVTHAVEGYLATAEVLGRRTGELHRHLGEGEGAEPAFSAEPFTGRDLTNQGRAMRADAEARLEALRTAYDRLPSEVQPLVRETLADAPRLLEPFDALARIPEGGLRIRCHGDYHLGQVLVTEGDVVIVDFEGEPARPLAERRAKCSPLRDVAGMLRSFSYAALTALHLAASGGTDRLERLAPWADLWERWVSAAFLRGYLEAARGSGFVPARRADLDLLLRAFVVDKAFYEIGYELDHRPAWLPVPLAGLLRLGREPHA